MFICMCIAVTENEIRECVRVGARTVDEVGEHCMAGTGCGGCHESIQLILEEGGALAAPRLCELSRSA